MRVLVSGASGLVGAALRPRLESRGHDWVQLIRDSTSPGADTIPWNPSAGKLDASAFDGIDAVVHLSGENIAGKRWTPEIKDRIYSSRIDSTRLLVETMAEAETPPKTFICASAIGYYGDRGDEVCVESDAPGEGFLADVCRDWEAAARPAADLGVRVVNVRIGIVLSPDGGALAAMLTPFRLGLGGPLGSGDMYMSWVSLHDLVRIIEHCLLADTVEGAVNATAPVPVTNAEFAQTLGRVLRRPAILRAPAFAIRMLLGEMGGALLLSSTRCAPKALQESDFGFDFPELEGALRNALES